MMVLGLDNKMEMMIDGRAFVLGTSDIMVSRHSVVVSMSMDKCVCLASGSVAKRYFVCLADMGTEDKSRY